MLLAKGLPLSAGGRAERTGVEIPGWVLDTIKEYSGLDASLLSAGALIQAVGQRVSELALQNSSAYWPVLRGHNTELNNLVQTLTNKETYFFREPGQFQALSSRVLPELMASPSRQGTAAKLRLWSAGCATGEEAYSLAMTVVEHGRATGARCEVAILATDIDATALERARQGCYDERAVRFVPDALRQRYLTRQGDRWRVQPEVARLVTFRTHNLAAATVAEDLAHFDVIFCRNVTIYFVESMRDRLNAYLAAQLREGGYLFVASAETLGHDRGRLALVSLGEGFAFRKGPAAEQPEALNSKQPASVRRRPAARPSSATFTPGSTGVPGVSAAPRSAANPAARQTRSTPPAPGVESPDASLSLEAGRRAFQEQAYDATLAYLDLLSPVDQAQPEPSCLRAAVLLQQERLEEANQICRRVLEADLWHPDAYLLLALGYRQQGHGAEAVDMLKQAVYLRPDDPQAHFFLGDTYRMLGLPAEARREYENTLNILERKAGGTPRVRFGPAGVNLAGVSDDLMRRACNTHLSRSGQRQGRGR